MIDGEQAVEVAGPADGHPVGSQTWEPGPCASKIVPDGVDAHRRAQPGQRVDRSLRSLADRLALVHRQALEQPPGRLGLDDVVDQRRLARTRHAGHDGEPALGEVDVDTLQVVGAGAAYADGIAGPSVGARLGAGTSPGAAFGDGRPAVLQASAIGATARAEIDAPVGGGDHVRLVLDDDHRAAVVRQPVEHREQPIEVAGVQTGRGLVEQHQVAGPAPWPPRGPAARVGLPHRRGSATVARASR